MIRSIRHTAVLAVVCALALAGAPRPADAFVSTANRIMMASTAAVLGLLAVDHQAGSIVTASSATSISSSQQTVGSGTNRALVVMLVIQSSSVSSPACYWDSSGTDQAMTLITSQTNTIGTAPDGPIPIFQAIFGLVAPTSGSKTLTCSFSGSSTIMAVGSISFSGANQTGGGTTFYSPQTYSGSLSPSGNIIYSTPYLTQTPYDAVVNNDACTSGEPEYSGCSTVSGASNNGTMVSGGYNVLNLGVSYTIAKSSVHFGNAGNDGYGSFYKYYNDILIGVRSL